MSNYRKDGTKFRICLDVVPITDPLGWYTYWFAVQRDVTEEGIHRVGNALDRLSESIVHLSTKLLPGIDDGRLKKIIKLLDEKDNEIVKETKQAREFIRYLKELEQEIAARVSDFSGELASIRKNVSDMKETMELQQEMPGSEE